MQQNRKKVSVLIPAYNEERCLDALYTELRAFMDAPEMAARYDFEVMVVDDGSRDATRHELRRLHALDPRISYISLSRNFGKEAALLAGMDYVSGDCCVIMDADLQHPLSAVPEMLHWWEEGYDDVYGSRLTRGREPRLRRWLTRRFYGLLQRSTRIEILPNVGDFRLLDRRVVRALCQLRESQRYTKGIYCWLGFRKKDVPFEQQDGTGRPSSFSFGRLFNLAMEGITSFTTAPLRMASVLGLLLALGSFGYLLFIVVKTLFFGESVRGFPTLMCTILLIGGIQLLTIGIIGEYIGRIFNETKNRPVYIVDEHNGQKV